MLPLLRIVFLALPFAMADKTDRRSRREEAVSTINGLAARAGLDTVPTRPQVQALKDLLAELADTLSEDALAQLREARKKWMDNGGGHLPEIDQEVQHDGQEGESES